MSQFEVHIPFQEHITAIAGYAAQSQEWQAQYTPEQLTAMGFDFSSFGDETALGKIANSLAALPDDIRNAPIETLVQDNYTPDPVKRLGGIGLRPEIQIQEAV